MLGQPRLQGPHPDVGGTFVLPGGFEVGDARAAGDAGPISSAELDPFLGPEFMVLRKLGQGSFGHVHLVRRRLTGEAFAVKRAHVDPQTDYANYRQLLLELQRWADLGEHPSFAALRFFWTLDDGVAVFSEFVAGGSLQDAVQDKRLYKGSTEDSLLRILDVAIQAAWALQVLHGRGYVHMDVKPGNLLLSADGTVKLADFGLLQIEERVPPARVAASRDAEAGKPQLRLGTMQYWSESQARGDPASPAMDIWSWSMTVLSLFAGGCTWPSGTLGATIMRSADRGFWRIEPPGPVRDVLAGCLEPSPATRICNAVEVVEALRAAVESDLKLTYGRALPAEGDTGSGDGLGPIRMTPDGGRWEDPAQWPSSYVEEPAPGRSRQGMVLGDLVRYEDRLHIIQSGQRPADQAAVWRLELDAALIQMAAGDDRGALLRLEQQIQRLRPLPQEDDPEALVALAEAFRRRAILLRKLGHLDPAICSSREATELYQGIPGKLRPQHEPSLAMAQMDLGSYLLDQGMVEKALRLHEEATERWRRLASGDDTFRPFHGMGLMNCGVSLCAAGNPEAGLELFEEALRELRAIRPPQQTTVGISSLTGAGGRPADGDQTTKAVPTEDLDKAWPWQGMLALAMFNDASCRASLGRKGQALAGFEEVAVLLQPLAQQGAETGWPRLLALTFANEAQQLRQSGQRVRAKQLFERSVEILAELVHVHGHWGLASLLEQVRKAAAIPRDLALPDIANGKLDVFPEFPAGIGGIWLTKGESHDGLAREAADALQMASGGAKLVTDLARGRLRRVMERMEMLLLDHPESSGLRSIQLEICVHLAHSLCATQEWSAAAEMARKALSLAEEDASLCGHRITYLMSLASAVLGTSLAGRALSWPRRSFLDLWHALLDAEKALEQAIIKAQEIPLADYPAAGKFTNLLAARKAEVNAVLGKLEAVQQQFALDALPRQQTSDAVVRAGRRREWQVSLAQWLRDLPPSASAEIALRLGADAVSASGRLEEGARSGPLLPARSFDWAAESLQSLAGLPCRLADRLADGHAALDSLSQAPIRQALLCMAREKAGDDGQTVELTVDIAPSPYPAYSCAALLEKGPASGSSGLAVNSPLVFCLRSRRAGFVTIVNIATSAEAWLLVPNAHTSACEARASAVEPCLIPGSALLPREALAADRCELREMGPPGWEHVLAFVSDEPLMSSNTLSGTASWSAFEALSADRLGALWKRLRALPPGSWSATSLSFRVTE